MKTILSSETNGKLKLHYTYAGSGSKRESVRSRAIKEVKNLLTELNTSIKDEADVIAKEYDFDNLESTPIELAFHFYPHVWNESLEKQATDLNWKPSNKPEKYHGVLGFLRVSLGKKSP